MDTNIDEFLSNMQQDIFQITGFQLTLGKFEGKWYEICADLAGVEQAAKIHNVDFSSYKTKLTRTFSLIFNHEYYLTAKAIYFEYDLDNDWQSSLFICNEYNSPSKQDEDWACAWSGESIEGPDFPILTSIYRQKKFDTFNASRRSRGITLCLVARTVSSFIEVVQRTTNIDKAICIGFHDQDPIMRIKLPSYG